ncbi:MAG: hypothetical protein HFF52_03435 [Lawsonibacter sp.]|nr:hypothetical protein [Lawsonibacter sp.]
MKALLDILTQYAEENLVPRLLREYTPKIQTARSRANIEAETLGALSPSAAEHVEMLKSELGNVYFFREQAFLLSGISIGLELGRL